MDYKWIDIVTKNHVAVVRLNKTEKLLEKHGFQTMDTKALSAIEPSLGAK